jgi:DNA-directed RNA polymerase subunit M/transcription elongation factor TFIIS
MISINNWNSKLRQQERILLTKYIQKHEMYPLINDEVVSNLSKKIERSIYNATCAYLDNKNLPMYENNLRFVKQYGIISYRVNSNIDPESLNFSQYFLQGIYNYIMYIKIKLLKRFKKLFDEEVYADLCNNIGVRYQINPDHIGYLSSQEINPTKFRDIVDDIELRLNQKVQKKISKLYKCHNCNKREVSYYSKQTRSFDEPETLFITCMFCGNQWKK